MRPFRPFSQRDLYHQGPHTPPTPRGAILLWLQSSLRVLLSLPRCAWVWVYSSPSPNILTRRLFTSAFVLVGVCIGSFLSFVFILYLTLPDVDEVGALFAAESSVITDRSGVELYRIYASEDRTLVPLGDIADTLEQATIAIEDERFYTRGCFDPQAFLRAVVRNIAGGYGSQGGSTLTQQFAKNALIGSRKKRITRKIKEYLLSCMLERRYTKDEILEFYLNRIPYGHNAHGAEQAARIYFAKSASGLSLAESVVLAALPQRPSYFSPYGFHVRTTLTERGWERLKAGKLRSLRDIEDEDFLIGLIGQELGGAGTGSSLHSPSIEWSTGEELYLGGRTDLVLQKMLEHGFITAEEKEQALQELQLLTFQRARENIRAPHFVFYVRELVEEQLSSDFEEGFLERGGLRVTTTLDYELQQIAERSVQEMVEYNRDLYGAGNAALFAVDVDTGQILAYVGNQDYWDEGADGRVDVVRSPRQPGSSFKPFAYAAAFLNGYGPATVLYDVPMRIGDDEPENFDRKFWGPITIRQALGASRNIPAAQSYFLAGGEEAIIPLAERLGVPSIRQRQEELTKQRGEPYSYGWPLAIGAAEVPLREMVQGYLTFARGGKVVDFTAILRIEDRHGNLLYRAPFDKSQGKPLDGAQDQLGLPLEREVLDPRVAYLITSILSDESARPTEYWRTQLSVPGFQAATKTGTSNKCLKRAPPPHAQTLGRCLDLKPDNNWTIGYTPEIVAGVWVGNASGEALYPRAAGLDTASHIWRPFMVRAHAYLQRSKGSLRTTFPIPEGLRSAQVSKLSGKLASSCTPPTARYAELFLEEFLPTEFDDACVEREVDRLTGLLASDECPPEAREQRAFFQPQSALLERFPDWQRAVERWAREVESGTGSIYLVNTGTGVILRGSGTFLPLPLSLAPMEICRLDLTPGRLIKPTVQILAPQALATVPSFQPEISYTVGQAVREVHYELDGRRVATGTPETILTPLIRLPRRFDPSGVHTFRVLLTDSYFNQAEDTVELHFGEDATPPEVTILSTSHGAFLPIGSTVQVRVNVEDPDGIVQRVQVELGGQLMAQEGLRNESRRNGKGQAYAFSFTVRGEEGARILKVLAWDGARNEGEDSIEVQLVRSPEGASPSS